MRAEMWRDGELEREEEHTLHINLYFMHELLLMLERAGFERPRSRRTPRRAAAAR